MFSQSVILDILSVPTRILLSQLAVCWFYYLWVELCIAQATPQQLFNFVVVSWMFVYMGVKLPAEEHAMSMGKLHDDNAFVERANFVEPWKKQTRSSLLLGYPNQNPDLFPLTTF